MKEKLTKFLKHALGEIMLVMIGILLALQVGDWSEDYKKSKDEKLLLQQLNKEFTDNRNQIKTVVLNHQNALDACDQILAMMPMNPKTVHLDSLASYIDTTFIKFTFNPSQGTINSLISTKSFDIISNKKLRIMLLQWEDLVEDYEEEELSASAFVENEFEPYINRHLSRLQGFKHKQTDLDFLTHIPFENMVYSRRFGLEAILHLDGELGKVEKAIEAIIALSAPKR